MALSVPTRSRTPQTWRRSSTSSATTSSSRAAGLTEHLEQNWAAVFAVTADEVAASFGTLTPPVDRAALTGEMAETMAAALRRAGLQGFVGWVNDDLTRADRRPQESSLAGFRGAGTR